MSLRLAVWGLLVAGIRWVLGAQDPEAARVVAGQLQWLALRPPVLPPRTREVTPAVRDLVQAVQPGGFILFRENLESPEQLRRLMEGLRGLCRIPPLFAIDEEGGSVTRLGRVPAFRVAARPAAPDWVPLSRPEFLDRARLLARDLKAHGFLVNLAPVADLDLVPGNPMRYRSFGSDPRRAAERVSWWVEAFQAEGVASVVKHFPGLGTTRVDTHHDRVALGLDKEQWMRQEGAVFHAAFRQGAEFLMLAHVYWPALTGDEDSIAFSPKVLQDLLRDELGFQGLVMTDALDMSAVTRYLTQADVAIRAIAAGVDIVAMSTQPREVAERLIEAYRNRAELRQRMVRAFERQTALKRRLLGWEG